MKPVNWSARYRSQAEAFTNLMRLWHTSQLDLGNPCNYEALVQTNPALRSALSQSSCLILVEDIRSGEYVFVSDNAGRLLGHAPELFCKKGLSFHRQHVHPDDLRRATVLRQMRNENLLTIAAPERAYFKFNCDYHFRKADGTYAWLFEQNTILHTDIQGQVTHVLAVISDITSWQKSLPTAASIPIGDAADHQDLPAEPLTVPLSKRECQIVQLMSEGCTSKAMAWRLNLSVHTINTHRRNIIERTRTKTTGGLVQYAISHGLI